MDWPSRDVDPPEPTRLGDVSWLEPYPDLLLAELPDDTPGPQARYEVREAISLAFVTALQLLPPRQRAALILRDVLGFATAEAAEILQASEQSVAGAVKRARATLARELPGEQQPPPPHSAAEQRLVARLTRAFEAADVNAIVGLLTEDAWVRMPPVPLEYQGRELAGRFLTLAFRSGRRYRLVATRANGQPAVGVYVYDRHAPVLHANGLIVLTLAGDQVSTITRFDASVLPRFGLPRSLPG
jgi:RNA polymerase sigma-70 factor (TIGR02960 family)